MARVVRPRASVWLVATPSSVSPDTVIGGDFRVLEPLRSGGMGTVYVALQLSTGKRRALKLMRGETLEDPKLRERFEQEAKVGSLIASDHVVEVIGAGIDAATSLPWIAMELLEGEDLTRFVREHGAPGFAEVREILSELCHAIGAAHSAGVVHRDLKPENVFLAKARTAEGKRTVKVLDFGIAKLLASARTGATAAVGTPAWMAPEQTDARVAITPATDIWALGLLTFWLLTGRSYWLSSASATPAVHAMLREVLFDPIEPASERARDRGAPGVLPEGFDDWFAKCVVRDPRTRFGTVAELLTGFLALAPPADGDGRHARPRVEAPSEEEALPPLSTRAFLAELEAGLPRARPSGAGSPTEPELAHGNDQAPAPPPLTEPSSPAPASDDGGEPADVPDQSSHAEPREPRRPASTTDGTPATSAATAGRATPARPAAGRVRAGWIVAGLAAGVLGTMAARAWLVAEPRAPVGSAPLPSEPILASSPAPTESSRAPTQSLPAAPEGSLTASAAPAASHDSSPAQTPGSAVRSTAARPTSEPTASASTSAEPQAPPFNAEAAKASVYFTAANAGRACGSLTGPPVVAVVVTYAPAGYVSSVAVDPPDSTAAHCVAGHMRGAHAPPFSGPSTPITTTVTFARPR